MSNDNNDKLEVPGAEDEKGKGRKGKKGDRAYVAKNSLVEEEFVKARDVARARVQGKKREDATEEEIHEDLRAANRLASFQARKRCKGNLDDLEKTVAHFEAAGEDQRKELEDQRERLQAVQKENEKLRQQLAAARQSESEDAATRRSDPDVPQQGNLQQHRKQQSDDHAVVYDMLSKLNQLQTEHRPTRQAQENRYTQDREALQARHSQQHQHLLMAQREQLKQLDSDHREEQRQLAQKHDDEALHCANLLGLHVGIGGNATTMFKDLDNPRQQKQQQQETAAAPLSFVYGKDQKGSKNSAGDSAS